MLVGQPLVFYEIEQRLKIIGYLLKYHIAVLIVGGLMITVYSRGMNDLNKVRKIEFAISNKPEDGDASGSGKVIMMFKESVLINEQACVLSAQSDTSEFIPSVAWLGLSVRAWRGWSLKRYSINDT